MENTQERIVDEVMGDRLSRCCGEAIKGAFCSKCGEHAE